MDAGLAGSVLLSSAAWEPAGSVPALGESRAEAPGAASSEEPTIAATMLSALKRRRSAKAS